MEQMRIEMQEEVFQCFSSIETYGSSDRKSRGANGYIIFYYKQNLKLLIRTNRSTKSRALDVLALFHHNCLFYFLSSSAYRLSSRRSPSAVASFLSRYIFPTPLQTDESRLIRSSLKRSAHLLTTAQNSIWRNFCCVNLTQNCDLLSRCLCLPFDVERRTIGQTKENWVCSVCLYSVSSAALCQVSYNFSKHPQDIWGLIFQCLNSTAWFSFSVYFSCSLLSAAVLDLFCSWRILLNSSRISIGFSMNKQLKRPRYINTYKWTFCFLSWLYLARHDYSKESRSPVCDSWT